MVKLGDRINILVAKYTQLVLDAFGEKAEGGNEEAADLCVEAHRIRQLLAEDICGALEATIQMVAYTGCDMPECTDFTTL